MKDFQNRQWQFVLCSLLVSRSQVFKSLLRLAMSSVGCKIGGGAELIRSFVPGPDWNGNEAVLQWAGCAD